MSARLRVGLAVVISGIAAASLIRAQTFLTDILLTGEPWAIDVNRLTGRVYVSNRLGPVTVIDEATLSVVGTIDIGPNQGGGSSIAVNWATNRIYWAEQFGPVVVADGNTNATIATLPARHNEGLAVNSVTNRIYVGDFFALVVVDGMTHNVVATVPLDTATGRVAVNDLTNMVYVGSQSSAVIWVIDGATNNLVARIEPGARYVAVSPSTNRIYTSGGYAGFQIMALHRSECTVSG